MHPLGTSADTHAAVPRGIRSDFRFKIIFARTDRTHKRRKATCPIPPRAQLLWSRRRRRWRGYWRANNAIAIEVNADGRLYLLHSRWLYL